MLPLGERLLRAAVRVGPPAVRSLDAIHIAAAASLGERLGVLISYDRRTLDAARKAGLAVASPG